MAIHAVAALPRLVALMALAAISTAAVAVAAPGSASEPIARPVSFRPVAPDQPLVVPDVRGQAHVFAKVSLEERGFAWKVRGRVRGYAANVVVQQSPAPGTRVYDTGQPLIVLELASTGRQARHGRPEDRSSYGGSRIRDFDHASVPVASPDRPEGRL